MSNYRRLALLFLLILSYQNSWSMQKESSIETIKDISEWTSQTMQQLFKHPKECNDSGKKYSVTRYETSFSKENIGLAYLLAKSVLDDTQKESENIQDQNLRHKKSLERTLLYYNPIKNSLSASTDNWDHVALTDATAYKNIVSQIKKGWWKTSASNHKATVHKAPNENFSFLIKRKRGNITPLLLNHFAKRMGVEISFFDEWYKPKNGEKATSYYCFVPNAQYSKIIKDLGLEVINT